MGRVRRGKYKCYECKAEWNIRKGSYLEGKKIELPDFIGCLKFFADGLDATETARELEVSPKLTRRVFAELRKLITGEIQQVPTDANGITFIIREVDGKILVETNPAEGVNHSYAKLEATRTINKEREFMFTYKFKIIKPKLVLRKIRKIDKLVYFYRFCKERLHTFRGRELNSLIAVMNELAFRYNHRNEDFLIILISKIINEK